MEGLKKLGKDSIQITKTGVALSVGGSLVSGNSNAVTGLNNLSKGLPLTGNILGSSAVFSTLKGVKVKK